MKKALSLIAIVALALIGHYGCGGSSASASTPNVPQVAGNYICSGNCGDMDSDSITTYQMRPNFFVVTQNDSEIHIIVEGFQILCSGIIDSTQIVSGDCIFSGDGNPKKAFLNITFDENNNLASMILTFDNTPDSDKPNEKAIIYTRK